MCNGCRETVFSSGWNGRLGQKNGGLTNVDHNTIECLVKQNTQSHNF